LSAGAALGILSEAINWSAAGVVVMFFSRRRKGQQVHAPSEGDEHGCGHEPPPDRTEHERTRLLQCWRRSEQRVLRTWHAWQAAAARDKPERYSAYLQALADEERAAASVQMAAEVGAEDADAGLVHPARH
jgi:hypothetical protein